MRRPSSLELAKPEILSYFDKASPRLYSEAELNGVLISEATTWALVKSTSLTSFVSFLIKTGAIKSHSFRSDAYDKNIVRYSSGSVSPYALALSLKTRGYLSHGTAAALHKLINTKPKTMYLNVEQSAKSPSRGVLTQAAIDQAFARQQRTSNYVFKSGSLSTTILAGKNTGRLGIEKVSDDNGMLLETTNLERTLIDIAVRPTYIGGVGAVLDAYRSAQERVSLRRLIDTLSELSYVYPYHQSIGFLMQAADYDITEIKKIPRKFDFHLTHGIASPRFSEEWRLYYPRNLNLKPPRRI